MASLRISIEYTGDDTFNEEVAAIRNIDHVEALIDKRDTVKWVAGEMWDAIRRMTHGVTDEELIELQSQEPLMPYEEDADIHTRCSKCLQSFLRQQEPASTDGQCNSGHRPLLKPEEPQPKWRMQWGDPS